MEVTLLIEATDSAFKILEESRKHAIGILDTTIELMAEETRFFEEKTSQALFTGAQRKKTRFQKGMKLSKDVKRSMSIGSCIKKRNRRL